MFVETSGPRRKKARSDRDIRRLRTNAGHGQNAALLALPGGFPRIPGLELLHRCVDQQVFRLADKGDQAPAHEPARRLALKTHDDRNRVRGQDTPARLVVPLRIDELPIPLGGGLGGGLETGAYDDMVPYSHVECTRNIPTYRASLCRYLYGRWFQTLADKRGRSRRARLCGMGSRRPERDARWRCLPTDPLSLYAKDYALIARCRRCEHARELHLALLLRVLGPQTTIEHVGARLRCSQCGLRGARIEPKYRGPTSSDWR
jgi:hypothetical protein